MKRILAVAFVFGVVAAEVPSHSYLPPPPRGYPHASSPPSVIAARALDVHEQTDHGYRSSHQPQEYTTVSTRYNDEQGFEHSSAGYTRSGLEEPNTTAGYDEERVKSQNYEDNDGLTRSSGYNENANNIRSHDGYQDGGHYHGSQDGGHNGYHSNQDGGHYQKNQENRNYN